MTTVPSYIRDMERPGALQSIYEDDRRHGVKRLWRHDGAGNWTSEVVAGPEGIPLHGAVTTVVQ